MIEIETVIIKLSNKCNLKCSYCYIYTFDDKSWDYLPSVLSFELFELTLKKLKLVYDKQKTKFDIVFHGGEPLTIGTNEIIKYFRKARDIMGNSVYLNLQTNGILLNTKIIQACKKYDILVSISLDGNAEQTKKHRINHNGKTMFNKIINNINICKNINSLGGILSVINVSNDPKDFFDFFLSLQVPSHNLLLPDGNYHNLPPYKIRNEQNSIYGDWLIKLFDYYFFQNDIKIEYFDKIMKQIIVRKNNIELPPKTYRGLIVTIDTNGEIKGNDVLRTTKFGVDSLGNINIGTFDLENLCILEEVKEIDKITYSVPTKCQSCNILNMCEGGYVTHRYDGNSFNNPSIYCHDYIVLYTHIKKVLDEHLSDC